MEICLCVHCAFAFGHVYLGLKDQLAVSSGAGGFVPTSAVDKVHEVCEGRLDLGVLLSALGAWQGLWLCVLTQMAANFFLLMHMFIYQANLSYEAALS